MKRPSFQFYPSDWSSDLKLRRCSPAARGVWVDILCALHDSDDGYGLIRWPLREIASTVGASMSHVRELVEKGVLRGSDSHVSEAFIYTPRSGRKDGKPVTLVDTQPGPLWYSKRLVKDDYVRTIRGESTRFGEGEGDAPEPEPKPSPKTTKGDGTTSSSSSPASASSLPAVEKKKRGKRAAPKEKPESVPVELLVAAGFDGETAAEFVAHKARLDAPLTARAWADHQREAAKVGWTPLEAAEKVLARGWKGFEAKYVNGTLPLGRANGFHSKQQAIEQHNDLVGEAWERRMAAEDERAH